MFWEPWLARHGRYGLQLRPLTEVFRGRRPTLQCRVSGCALSYIPGLQTIIITTQVRKRVAQGGMEISQSIRWSNATLLHATAHHPFALLNTKGWLAEPGGLYQKDARKARQDMAWHGMQGPRQIPLPWSHPY